jgi:nucleotide-binding universal stress UspA family protein
MPMYDQTFDAAFKEQERNYLDGVVKRLAKIASAPVTSVLADGLIVDSILQAIQRKSVDLVIMTTHGRGPLSRFWLGGVADELLRRCNVPILLIRPTEDAIDWGQQPAWRHLLVPLDGSELAEEILAPAMTLGGLMQAQYTLLRVVEPVSDRDFEAEVFEINPADQSLLERRQQAAQVYLDGVADRLRGRAKRIHTKVVVSENNAVAIHNACQQFDADLIAIATHGRGGLKRLLLGSVADKVIRGTTTPVLVYRQSEPEASPTASS